jgi:hypothetical protein
MRSSGPKASLFFFFLIKKREEVGKGFLSAYLDNFKHKKIHFELKKILIIPKYTPHEHIFIVLPMNCTKYTPQ